MYYRLLRGGDNVEQLMQKYIKYFYIVLIVIIAIQLLGTVIETLISGLQCGALVSMILFLVNIILLTDAVKHNVRQQFTECKEDARILRFTLGLLALVRMFACCHVDLDWIALTDYIMIIGVIEIVLAHRIKSIELLERLASKVVKEDTLDQKGG